MKQLLFLLLFPCLALAQYTGNGNQKITLGEQSTADGLVFRGLASIDTVTATSKITRANKQDTSAFLLLDTVTNLLWHYKTASNGWIQAGGSTFDTTTLNLVSRFGLKLNIADTTAMLLPYFRDADTTTLNLTSRFATKQNNITLTTTGTSGAATLTGATLNIPQYSGGGGISDGDKGDIDVTNSGATWTIDTSAISLSGNKVTGTLPVANGGTNRTTMPAGYLLHGDGTSVDTSIGLFYNTTNNRLGLGSSSPLSPLHVETAVTKTSTNFWHFTMFDKTPVGIGVGGGFIFGGFKSATALEAFAAIDSYKETSSVTPGANAAGVMRFHTQPSDGSGLVEGMRLSSTQELGIGYGGTDNGAYKLQVNSQIFATNATIATSDIRFKENIQPLDKGLEIINKLKPVKFNFITTTENNFSEFDEIGFIAQDVEGALSTELFAKAVVKKLDEDKDDSALGLMTEKFIPILVKAIQEQQALIKALEQRIINLENK
jgi:hypothetical protein